MARHSSSPCIQSSGVLPKLKFQLSYLLAQRRSDIEAKLEKLEKEAAKMRLEVH